MEMDRLILKVEPSMQNAILMQVLQLVVERMVMLQ